MKKLEGGVPTIISKYSKKSISINDNSITVTIPFNRINEIGDKVGDKKLTLSQIKVLAEIRNNANITKPQLVILCNLSKTSIDNAISKLKHEGYIKRVGSNKTGYWEILK